MRVLNNWLAVESHSRAVRASLRGDVSSRSDDAGAWAAWLPRVTLAVPARASRFLHRPRKRCGAQAAGGAEAERSRCPQSARCALADSRRSAEGRQAAGRGAKGSLQGKAAEQP